MLSENAKRITDIIYKMYGTDSGIVFGLSPTLKESVSAIVEATLFINNEDRIRDTIQIDEGEHPDWHDEDELRVQNMRG